MIKSISLNKLVPSPRNVRRVVDEQADAELMADIEARGLLQNLVVSGPARPRGSFAVEAGGRRLRALQRLAEAGRLPKDHEVCCLVVEGGAAAQEASLAENFQRLSMNPADECVAFRQLIEQGCEVEGIARRFGLTSRFVEGRLRLAGLAPTIFEALGSGEIGLDVAKAYAASADQERQAYVFEQMSRGYGAAHPDSIRRMMTQASVSAGDRRARFVGEDAYVAAGGRIERDLFTPDADARWLDIALLERLAAEKMQRAADEKAQALGLAFVRPTLANWVGQADTEGLRRIPLEAPPLTEAECALIDQLEAEVEDLVDLLQVEETGESERVAADARIRELSARIDTITGKPPVLDEAQRSEVGAFLMLDQYGEPRLDPAYYAVIAADDPPGATGELEEQEPVPEERLAKAGGLSQRLLDELAMQRRDILAVHVASDPAFAVDLAIFLMIDGRAAFRGEKSGSSLIAPYPSDPLLDFRTPEASATLARQDCERALDLGWTEHETRAERFDAFRALPEDSRGLWLAHAVARTLEASLNRAGDRSCGFHDHLGRLLDIDVARWWRPTGANYFDRVPKVLALAALDEVGGPTLAARYAKAKKAELAQACERIFSGDFIAEVEVKDAALAWLPEAMRFAPSSARDGEPAASRDVADGATDEAPSDDAGAGSQENVEEAA